jgi:DNA sulfur modification protein DndD
MRRGPKVKLSHLVVSNVGPFRGRHVFDFESEQNGNGFAFFAENGRGKTSLYNAMRWALWGEVLPRVRAVRGSAVRTAPIPIVGEPGDDILLNSDALREDSKAEMSVVLLATREDGRRIQVMRTASSTTTLPRFDEDMKVSLDVNDGEEAHSGPAAQEAVERFFPRELERFFFIDGEALEEYTDMLEQDSERGLKEDVEAVLRLPALTRGREDLKQIARDVSTRLSRSAKANNASQKAERDYHAKQKSLRDVRHKIESLKGQISAGSVRLKEIETRQQENADLRAIHEERASVRGTLPLLESQLQRATEKRNRHAKDAWKSLIWIRAGPMQQILNEQMDRINNAEPKRRELERRILRAHESMNNADAICPTCQQELVSKTALVANLERDIEEAREELAALEQSDLMTSDEAGIKNGRLLELKPPNGNATLLADADKEWARVKQQLLDAQEKLEGLNKRISDDDSSSISELSKEFGRLTNQQKTRREDLRGLERDEQSLTNDVAGLRKKVGGNDDSIDREIDDIVRRLLKTIEGTLVTYTEEARKRTSTLASDAFMAMTNAPETFSGVELDQDFRGRIKRHDGKTAVRPSSGMKSIMTVSIIDALRKVSGLRAPVFFDTPGRSLDEKHKQEFLEHFWRADHGMQFLIFAHSGEFRLSETVDEFGDRIAKAWTLTFPGDHRKCIECDGDTTFDRSTRKRTCLDRDCLHQWDTGVQQTLVKEVRIDV